MVVVVRFDADIACIELPKATVITIITPTSDLVASFAISITANVRDRGDRPVDVEDSSCVRGGPED